MSEKINELVLMVKDHMNLGEKESQESLREIENKIDDKHLEIRDIFSRNNDSVMDHYIKYQEIISNQKKLDNYCEEFTKRIEKTQNLSQYDEKMIERSQNAIQNLRKKKTEVDRYRVIIMVMQESVNKLKKAAFFIEEERYNNAIKLINSYKETEPTLKTPLSKALPIFLAKINLHLQKLANHFWSVNKAKILEIGSLCYNKVELSIHEKTNIYQAFFGRNTSNRNSMIRKSSIIEEGRVEAPLRFLKKIKDEEILQKYIFRLNICMNSLKQMRILCKQLQDEGIFQEIVNKQVLKFISDLASETASESEADLKKLLSSYIGFLLFRREVVAFFNMKNESKIMFGQIYSHIGKVTKNLLSRP